VAVLGHLVPAQGAERRRPCSLWTVCICQVRIFCHPPSKASLADRRGEKCTVYESAQFWWFFFQDLSA
jgi:hypothetical protein